MRKLTSHELKNLNLLKHYRIIRKWACKTCDLKEPDLELLIYLNSLPAKTALLNGIILKNFKED